MFLARLVIVGEASDFSLSDDGSGDQITRTEGLIVLLVCEDVLGGDHGLGGDDDAPRLDLRHRGEVGLDLADHTLR